MNRMLKSSWMISLIGCLIYLATTAVVLSSVRFEGVVPEEEFTSPDDAPSWRFRNPEFEQWVQDLQREKADFETRKAQLNEWETRLKAERQELTAMTQRVVQLQADFDRNVVRLRDQEAKNLKKQAKTMSDMSPEAAAALIGKMSEDDAARLLSVMNGSQSAQMLEILGKSGLGQAKHAAAITERMRHLLPDTPNPSSP